MLKRYSTPEMTTIWSDKERFRNWVRVEVAVLRAKNIFSLTQIDVPENLVDMIVVDPRAINRIEAEKTGHDVKAFLEYTEPQLPVNLQPHWHDGMTSYDTQDTATCLTLVDSVQLLKSRLTILLVTVYYLAIKYKHTPMIGRTHGIHAEPITLGVKFANWYAELARHIASLEEMEKIVAVGKISGAVGMYTLDPGIEEEACKILGLRPITATQIIARDIFARYVSLLAIITGTIEKMAITVRMLQRTEVREMQEYFRKGQTGSSAMPHKRNPIGSENLSGMGRVMRGYAHMANESIQTWDERSIDNSGPERIYLPDASILLDYVLRRMDGILKKIIIRPERMEQNIWLTKGLIFSQEITSLVVKKSGLPREMAYELVYNIAQDCWESGHSFFCALLNDQNLMERIDVNDLLPCFNLDKKLQHVDHIFKMVFGKQSQLPF
jgi:adenylosuccinate lyase